MKKERKKREENDKPFSSLAVAEYHPRTLEATDGPWQCECAAGMQRFGGTSLESCYISNKSEICEVLIPSETCLQGVMVVVFIILD